MTGQVEEPVDLGDRHLLRAGAEEVDLVSRLDVTLFEHAKVEARTVMGDEQSGDPRVVHPDPDAVAGDAWLSDLEDRGADPVAVADADVGVGQSLDGEVLAELPVDEVVPAELALPVSVRLHLVDEDGALLAAVPGEIALPVAVDVELAHTARAGDSLLEDAGEDGLPLPWHVFRLADVDRQQLADGRARRSSVERRSCVARCRAHAPTPGEMMHPWRCRHSIMS